MPDYNKGCIYLIKHNQDFNNENIYIGSCCNFTRRKSAHKSVCNNPNDKNYNVKLYKTIREQDGWENWVMIKMHDYPCNEKYELNKEERRVVDEYKAKLNCVIPTRTDKEYYEVNKEKITGNKKEYYQFNKEKIAENKKEYYQVNKEKITGKKSEYYEANKEQRKKYLEANREHILKKRKEYYEANRQKIAERRKTIREAIKKK